MRLFASFVVAALSSGCASTPDEQRALNVCLWSKEQAGCQFLPTPPVNAETLRAAIVASGKRPLPVYPRFIESKDQEASASIQQLLSVVEEADRELASREKT